MVLVVCTNLLGFMYLLYYNFTYTYTETCRIILEGITTDSATTLPEAEKFIDLWQDARDVGTLITLVSTCTVLISLCHLIQVTSLNARRVSY